MTAEDLDQPSLPRGFKSFWPIISLVPLFASLILCACSQGDTIKNAIKNGALTVNKEPPQVEVKALAADEVKARAKASNNRPRPEDVDAFTEWFYSCKADLSTEDVFHDDTIGASSMALKIKGIKFRLALPITVHLPANATAALKEHEDGHVKICSIIYGRADSACEEAAREVLGKTFNGMGNDPAAAKNMALAQAQHIIAQGYHEGTSTLADQASEKYELLCLQYAANPKMSRQTLAGEACKRVLDIPVTVIK